MKSRFFGTAVVGLVGAIVGSFSMMLFASTHFANVAGPGNQPPSVSAAPLTSGGTSDQDRIVSAVKRVTPSVVALNVVINGTRMVPTDPFAQFFGGGQGGGQVQRYRARASGSGFVYSRDGLIVTNAHVVPVGTSSVEVVFANGDRAKAHVYSRDPAADLALVKTDGYSKVPPPVELGNSDRLSAGQWAIAIGEPFELQQSVSVGVVSGFNRDETIGGDGGAPRQFKGLLQTSAPINPGNSGWPLIDVEGHLIGVNQSTANVQAGAQGIGFAIPVNLMKTEVAVLEKNQGQTINANATGTGVSFLGVQLAELTPDVRAQINYQGAGVAVTGVQPDGPADKVGIGPGDVITEFNGKAVTSVTELQKLIRALKPGASADVIYVSSGMKKKATVKLGEAPVGYNQQQQQQP